MRAWNAWSPGDFARTISALDEAAARNAIDPVLWFHSFVAYLRLGDAERMSRFATTLRDAAATDPRGAFFTAIPQPYDQSRTAEHAHHAVEWADRTLAIAVANNWPTGIANAHQIRAVALRHSDADAARAAFLHAIDIASGVQQDHLIVDAGLSGLAHLTAIHGEIAEALRCSRDAVASAARYRYISSLVLRCSTALSRSPEPAIPTPPPPSSTVSAPTATGSGRRPTPRSTHPSPRTPHRINSSRSPCSTLPR